MRFMSRRNNLATALTTITCVISILAVLIFPFRSTAMARQAEVALTILHVNDTHGHIVPYLDKNIDPEKPVSGAEYLAGMVERERKANPNGTILLSGGDMFQGTPISNVFQGKPVVEIMNYLHYDAMVLGNHEFDWGQDTLHSIVSSASFPVISANTLKRGGGRLPGVKPYVILKRQGIRIAIIGITTPETYYSSKPENLTGLTFASPEKVLPPIIRHVRAKGASLVVVLSHEGLEADRLLARKVSGIDIIVGGHSHTTVKDPVVESGTVIVQAGSNGIYLGALHVVINKKTKKVVSFTRRDELELVSPSAGVQMDPSVAQIVDRYESQVKAEFSRVIGTAAVDLVRDPNRESNLGDIIADAMRQSSGAQIAFQNRGGIRADIPKGPITLETLFTVLPFDDDIISMELTGEQILEMLEKSVQAENLLQVSGMRIVYDLSNPSGGKVVTAEVAGKPLESRKTYRVATNDFLASVGGTFEVLKKGTNVTTGQPQRDAVADYIGKNSPINAPTMERVVFRN